MPLNLVEEIKICEVGPRDGLQNEKRILTTEEKLVLIEGVVQAGFSVIEVGSFMSPKAVPQMANTDEVFQNLKRKEGVEYRALVANLKGCEPGRRLRLQKGQAEWSPPVKRTILPT